MIEYGIRHGGRTYRFAVSDNNDGLFIWGRAPNQPSPQWIQLEGTCDFDASGVKHVADKIRRYMDKQEWEFPARVAEAVTED